MDRIEASRRVWEACRQDPLLRDAINILLAEARDARTELDAMAAQYHARDLGKTGGRPRVIDWARVFALDATLDSGIHRKSERAARIRRKMKEEGLSPVPSHDELQRRLPTRR
ncbi:hypothetical protein [Aliiruegeria lutimaris]|uniref:Uncharacterized protein n=1 Tax=Aliiruegeria lutimaris TaxID=571298 RepID=A0A1G8KJY4_9RHOB|nr:hypothetical protein [Aliiruegeria lutimaris]SDI43686.1 hypothetical protein SAMN04488026_100311 [Aliiruegeria lutimaris]